ncbi:hypothetical protein PBI_PEREGRIN_15 [Rhodococcus phage Peregrin]|nr:hypothetical protein PBI_PEREGRIN_15 [Rhodococcus phage Peregrin]
MVVHNHAPWRGPGPDGTCAERTINGKLRGDCIMGEDLRYTAEKVFKCSIDFTEEELKSLGGLMQWVQINSSFGDKYLDLETRLLEIVDEVL